MTRTDQRDLLAAAARSRAGQGGLTPARQRVVDLAEPAGVPAVLARGLAGSGARHHAAAGALRRHVP